MREKHIAFEGYLAQITKMMEKLEVMLLGQPQAHLKHQSVVLLQAWETLLSDLIAENSLYSPENFHLFAQKVDQFYEEVSVYPEFSDVSAYVEKVFQRLEHGPLPWKGDYAPEVFERITARDLLQYEGALNRGATFKTIEQRNIKIILLAVGHQLYASVEEGGFHGRLYEKLMDAFQERGYRGPKVIIASAYLRFSRRGDQKILTLHRNSIYTTPKTRERIRAFLQAKNPHLHVIVDPRPEE